MIEATERQKRAGAGFGPIVAAGIAATVAGHELAYRLTYFSGHERAAAMARSGHAYWPSAIRVALVLSVVGVVLQVARGRLSARPIPSLVSLALRLGTIQLGLFAMMEITERLFEHQSPLTLAAEAAFWIGVPAQLLVAVLVAFVLRIARRAGQVLGRLFSSRRPVKRTREWEAPEASPILVASIGTSWRTRAPPLEVVPI